MDRYFLNICGVEKEVTKEEYIKMEESCGFYSKFEGEVACFSFGIHKGSIEINGKIQRDSAHSDGEF